MTSSSAVSNEKRFERAQRLMMAWLRAERADRVDAHCNGLGDVESTTWRLTADGERIGPDGWWCAFRILLILARCGGCQRGVQTSTYSLARCVHHHNSDQ